MKKASQRSYAFLSFLLACAMLIGMLPVGVFAAEPQTAEKATKVIISVEGQTLGQGFYIEPTIVTFDKFIQYWKHKDGTTVKPEEITAGGMLSYALAQNGTPMASGESVSGPGYLASILGIDKGTAKLPQFLADAGVTLTKTEDTPGSEVREKEYTPMAGWMYTEGNIMSDQALAGHTFYTYGTPYTQGGESYYVVRLQYSVAGLGADLGFSRHADYPYSYEAADKGQLYILYARLSASGFFDKFPHVQEQALKAMNTLNATQEEVDSAYEALLTAGSAEKPMFAQDLPEEYINYPVPSDKAAPLEVEISVSKGTLSYQWFKSDDRFHWTAIDGETGISYTPSAAEKGTTYYKCEVTNTEGFKLSTTVRSAIATVIVGDIPDKPGGMYGLWPDLEVSKEYAWRVQGQTPLTVGAGYMAPPMHYQWYQGPAGVLCIDDMTPIDGATKPNYLPDVSKEGITVYACRIININEDGNRNFTDSKLCTVTVKNKTVLISTEEELRKMQPDGIYQLMNDIELTGPWTPVDGFSGVLDGNGHTISGLDVQYEGFYGAGLFSYTMKGATIKNLGVVGNASVSPDSPSADNASASGLIGAIFGDTTISNCYVNVQASTAGLYSSAGGIVGTISGGTTNLIQNCYFTGTAVTDSKYYTAGGLIGENQSSATTVRNCYTTNDIAIGNYGSADGSDWNNYCASNSDPYAAKIPEDMDAFLISLNNGENAFVSDTDNINNGYPVLSWQVEEPVTPPNPADKEKEIQAILERVSDLYKGSGEDWSVIDLAAYGFGPEAMNIEQLKRNAESVAKDKNASSTDLERVALALTAARIDASVFKLSNGQTFNFIEEIANFGRNGRYHLGTVNGYIFALIAYDCGNYDLPANAYWTRDKIIDYLLSVQGSDGGWNLGAEPAQPSDVDLTAMAISALAGYCDNAEVSAALEKAVAFLSSAQKENGNFASSGVENSNSVSQVMIALAALDINADADPLFVKNGKSALDSLLSFQTEDNQFGFTNNIYNGMSTDQGFRALVAYTNWKAAGGAYNVYDMSDMEVIPDPEPPKPEEKDITLTDVNGTGITLTGKDSILNDHMELEANPVTSGNLYDQAKAALKDGKFTLYDLYLLENNLEVQPTGTVTISIPVPAGYNGAKCQIYQVNADGSVAEIIASLANGKLVFDASQMGTFAVYQPIADETGDPNGDSGDTTVPNPGGNDGTAKPGGNGGTTESPQTGDNSNMALWLTIFPLSLAALAVLGRKIKTIK